MNPDYDYYILSFILMWHLNLLNAYHVKQVRFITLVMSSGFHLYNNLDLVIVVVMDKHLFIFIDLI